MATVDPTLVKTPISGSGFEIWAWRSINDGDTCTPAICGSFPDRTIYFLKGAGFGGNMLLEGSPEPNGTVYVTLNDPQGNAISGISSDKAETVLETAYKVRPSPGAGVAAVDAILVLSTGGR